MDKERVLAKTLIPNSIIVFSAIYISVIYFLIQNAEKIIGAIFSAITLAFCLLIILYFRDKYSCVLKVAETKFIIKYFHPSFKNVEYRFDKVQSNIMIKRFCQGEFAGGLPKLADYLNYKWYFTAEKYELSFQYDGQPISIMIQPNIIYLQKTLNLLVEKINALLFLKPESIDNDFGKKELAYTLSVAIIKLIIPDVIKD